MVGLLNKALAAGCMVFAVHANAQTETALEGEERPKEVRYNLCDCLEDDRKEEGAIFYYTDLFLDEDSVVNMEIHWSYSKLENGEANSDLVVLGMLDGMEYTGNVMAEELYQDSLFVKTYRFDDLIPTERMQPALLLFGERLFRFNRRALADDAFPCGEFFIKPKEE